VNQYALLEVIERRRNSELYMSYDMDRRQYVCVRAVHLGMGRYDGFTLQRELRVYRRLSHTSVVKISEVLHSTKLDTAWGVLREVPLYGPLARLLPLSVPEQILSSIFAHVCSAVSYLHSQGLVHQNVSVDDILLCPPGVAKLSDSGVGHRCDELIVGRPVYVAPETLDDASDALIDPVKECVWAIGVCLFAAAFGHLPYAGESEAEVFARINLGKLEFPGGRSDSLVALLRGMLEVDARARWGLEEVRGHPFFEQATPVFMLPLEYIELPPPPLPKEVVHVTAAACDENHTFLSLH
jgi:serine/threonine protein kinase